jgi:hypothetical protein
MKNVNPAQELERSGLIKRERLLSSEIGLRSDGGLATHRLLLQQRSLGDCLAQRSERWIRSVGPRGHYAVEEIMENAERLIFSPF